LTPKKVGLKKGEFMKTQHRHSPTLHGFTDYGDRIKELKTKRPDIYKALKSPEPLACLAWNVIELRGEKGWSQQQLADKSGVAKRVIAYIESYSDGYNTSVNIVQKLARAMSVPFRRMFEEVDLTKV
jgi:DNA-binding XRE family transcriptional regulator